MTERENKYIKVQEKIYEVIKELDNHEKLFVLDVIVHRIRNENRKAIR